MFITFDGGDGCGKTTQILRLADWLDCQGEEVVLCRDPGSTTLGHSIRVILLDQLGLPISSKSEVFLFMAARAQMVEEIIRPALEKKRFVLSDRYLLSTLAYQGFGGQLPISTLRQIGKFATSNIRPDLGIVLDLPYDLAKGRTTHRSEPDRMERKTPQYHERVRQGFLQLAQEEPERYRVVDASLSLEAVESHIHSIVAEKLQTLSSKSRKKRI